MYTKATLAMAYSHGQCGPWSWPQVLLQKLPIDFKILRVLFAKGKWPCPLKGEIPGLL